MREYGSNINLPSLDNLFSSEQERQDAKLEKIQILPLTELHPFRNHPFQVRDDDEMDKMVDSVKEYGVMTPAIVRPRKDGGCSKAQSRLKYNRQVNDEGITVRGRFLICGLNGDKVVGLSKDQADRYSRLLFLPQVEDMASGELPAAKVRPQDERYGNKLSFWERLER